MSRLVGGTDLYKALQAEEFPLPPNCSDLSLEMPVDGVFVLHYKQLLEQEDLEMLGKALVRVAKRDF